MDHPINLDAVEGDHKRLINLALMDAINLVSDEEEEGEEGKEGNPIIL